MSQTDKAFSDIERDIRQYYDHIPGHVTDPELVSLMIAGRALAIALQHVEPAAVQPLREARAVITLLIGQRQRELERATEVQPQ
jgi:hypothetical protein